jgi:hypothetical protein
MLRSLGGDLSDAAIFSAAIYQMQRSLVQRFIRCTDILAGIYQMRRYLFIFSTVDSFLYPARELNSNNNY